MDVRDIVTEARRNTGRTARLVFGPGYEIGGTTVIPVARVRVHFSRTGGGRGAGVAGALRIAPAGFITVRGERADFTPIRDYTRLILLGIVCAAVVLSVLVPLAVGRGERSGESGAARRG